MVEERDNVLLDNVSSLFSFFTLSVFLDNRVDFLQCFYNNDSISSVGILPRFYQPCVSSFRFKSILHLIIRIGLFILLLLSDLLLSFVIFFEEIIELFISFLFNMESHWYVCKWILVFALIVSFEIHKQRFFV